MRRLPMQPPLEVTRRRGPRAALSRPCLRPLVLVVEGVKGVAAEAGVLVGSVITYLHDEKLPLGFTQEDLAKKVGETYARCGFDYDPTMSTVQMLTQIESKLERCLAVADEMPAAYVRESEKAREKERRAKQRAEKAAIDLAAAEEKAKRSLERSMSQVAKKVGKPLMTRSQPPSRKKKVVKEQLTEEEAELRAFLATEF